VSTWIGLLRDTKLIRALDRGSTGTKASVRLRARPKLYAADHGLVAAFAELPDDPHVRSRVFEAVVYRHLREVALERTGSLRYLKWDNDLELDFLLDLGAESFAVEVTTSKEPKAEKRQRLHRAASRVRARRAVLVHDGSAEGELSGVVLVPIERFLRDPWSALTGGR
jgi:predicted AAA+ superfamily ATPase